MRKQHNLNNRHLNNLMFQMSVELICIERSQITRLHKIFFRDALNEMYTDLHVWEACLLKRARFYIALVANGSLVEIFDFYHPIYSNLLMCYDELAENSTFHLSLLSVLDYIDPNDIDRVLPFLGTQNLTLSLN